MNAQQSAIQSAIDKLEALKAKCAGITCRTLEDQADSALAAIDVCRSFHEIQADALIQLVEVACEAGNAVVTKGERAALACRDDLDDALYDAQQWAEEHAGDRTYSQCHYRTYNTLRGSVA